MRPIRQGDRGPAVEDVQRRLLALGYELGPTGVDGVFLGATRSAVRSFQQGLGLTEDGIVGGETWASLVDATFTLGDRVLYLRSPLFHGRDVEALQRALNALGFSCGAADGMFGAYTERAVREFQLSCGLPVDGIVGSETVRSVNGLRHVWDGKEGLAAGDMRLAAARAAQVLESVRLMLAAPGDDAEARDVAERVANLAHAANEDAYVTVVSEGGDGAVADVTIHLTSRDAEAPAGCPVVAVDPEDPGASATRIVTALGGRCRSGVAVVRLAAATHPDEASSQRAAVAILDGICAALG